MAAIEKYKGHGRPTPIAPGIPGTYWPTAELPDKNRHPLHIAVEQAIGNTSALAALDQPELDDYVFQPDSHGNTIIKDGDYFARSIAIDETDITDGLDESRGRFGFIETESGYFLAIYTQDPSTGEKKALLDRLEPLDKWRTEGIQIIEDLIVQMDIKKRAEEIRRTGRIHRIGQEITKRLRRQSQA